MRSFSKPHEYAPLATLREPHKVSTKVGVYDPTQEIDPDIDVGDSFAGWCSFIRLW